MRNCSPPTLEPICPSGYEVNDCGAYRPPNVEYVDLPAVLPYATLLPAHSVKIDARQRVYESYDFVLLSMTSQADPANPDLAFYYRIQFPDGRYSSNKRQSVLFTAGRGNRKRTFDPGEIYQAGLFIPFELENPTDEDLTVSILFEGFKRIYIRDTGASATNG